MKKIRFVIAIVFAVFTSFNGRSGQQKTGITTTAGLYNAATAMPPHK